MELISKEYVVELLNRKQMELDAFGETDSAVEVAKAKFTISQLKPDLIIPDNTTNGDVIPLDRVKQAREDMRSKKNTASLMFEAECYNNGIVECLAILDKLISESEDK